MKKKYCTVFLNIILCWSFFTSLYTPSHANTLLVKKNIKRLLPLPKKHTKTKTNSRDLNASSTPMSEGKTPHSVTIEQVDMFIS